MGSPLKFVTDTAQRAFAPITKTLGRAFTLPGMGAEPEPAPTPPPTPIEATQPAKPIAGSKPGKKSAVPTFLAAATFLPPETGTGGGGGKTLLGQ